MKPNAKVKWAVDVAVSRGVHGVVIAQRDMSAVDVAKVLDMLAEPEINGAGEQTEYILIRRRHDG